MNQPIGFYVEELYNRAYYLFLASNNLRGITSSSYLTDEQKQTIAKPMVEQIIVESDGLSTRADEIYQHFYPGPVAFSFGTPPLPAEDAEVSVEEQE